MTHKPIDIDALKQEHGEIKEISADGLTAYFRKPDLRRWRFAVKVIDKSHTEFKKTLAVNCFVGGDKALIEPPYIDDVAEVVDEFISYVDAEVERDGNAYQVKVLDKSCRLRPVNIEIQTNAERNNPKDIPFMTQQNMLKAMWISGDDEILNEKFLDYHMPVLRALTELREKHALSIKNV